MTVIRPTQGTLRGVWGQALDDWLDLFTRADPNSSPEGVIRGDALLTALNGSLSSIAAMRAGTAPAQDETAATISLLSMRAAALESANRFSNSRTVTIDNSAGPSKATPWMVKAALTSSNMTFANARNDGRDIQFRLPDGSLAPHWIASYDPVGQTAEIWVRIPPLGATTLTITMLYGNPNWVSPFKLTDVFPAGTSFDYVNDAWTHPTLSAQTLILPKDEAWESTSAAHTLDIVDFGTTGKVAPNGTTYRFWGWYGHYGSDGIGLAFTNDLSGQWTKYASNPILANGTAATRWATVKQADDGTLHMIVHNTTSNTLTRYTLSADGITPTLVETVANDSGFTMGNPFLFRDPATNEYILWLFRQRVSDSLQQVCYRRATTIPGLTQAKTVVSSSSPIVWAAPAMTYFDGLYWLYTEDFDGAGQLWRTVVGTSPSPTGPFVACANSLLLSADQPCARSYVVDGTLYLFNAQRNNQDNANWTFGVHTATPAKSKPALPAIQNSTDRIQSYSNYGYPSIQYDSALGAGSAVPLSGRFSAVGDTTNVSKSILAANALPADCILVARVAKQTSPNVFFGVRGSVVGNRYRFDVGSATGHIDTSTGWHAGGTHILTQGGLSGWTVGAYHVVECICLGTTISCKIDGVQVMTVTDSSIAAGGYCAVETPNGTDLTLDYIFARPYDGTDPTVTVGTIELASTLTPSRTRERLAAQAAGIITESESPGTLAIFTAPSSGAVYGRLVGLVAGDVVTGILVRVSVAAAGTSPTTVRAGISNASGKILAISGNLNATAFAATGAALLALAAPYTITQDGGYFLCFMVNGTWGTTQPTLLNGGVQPAAVGARSGYAPPAITWTGQTDLPSVGSLLTLSTASVRGFYQGAY